MTAKLPGLYVEEILALAADTMTATEAQRLAHPDYWRDLGRDTHQIWGYFRAEPVIETVIDLAALSLNPASLRCSCWGQKPCKHLVGLLLLWNQNNPLFKPGKAPTPESNRVALRPLNPLPDAEMLNTIRQGLGQLDQWLTNLIRQGLAEPRVRDYPFWDEMADRMLAARMPGLSQWLREIANIAVRGGDWVEALLEELGRMALLSASFAHFEQLAPEIQADLRETVGWRLTRDSLPATTPVQDHWLVLGQRERALRDQTPEQFTWLYGTASRRRALLHSLGGKEVMQTSALTVGAVVAAELVYLPSRTPLKALLLHQGESVARPPILGWGIGSAIKEFGAALAGNPWLRYYPLLLAEVYITRFGKGWTVREANGDYLPIAPYFQPKWAIYGFHGGHPVQMAGIWDGKTLNPISLITVDRMIDLNHVIPYSKMKGKLAMS